MQLLLVIWWLHFGIGCNFFLGLALFCYVCILSQSTNILPVSLYIPWHSVWYLISLYFSLLQEDENHVLCLIFTTDLYIICNSCGASVFSKYHFSFVRKCFGWFWGQKAVAGICIAWMGWKMWWGEWIPYEAYIHLKFCDVLSCWYWVVAPFDGLV